MSLEYKFEKYIPGKTIIMDSSSIKLLCSYFKPDARVLEWGSVGSTLFFNTFAKSWDTIEHDEKSAVKLQNYTKMQEAVHIYHVNHTRNGENDGAFEEFKAYINFLRRLNRSYDIVIVDGRARVPCTLETIRHGLLAPRGVVVFTTGNDKLIRRSYIGI